MAERCPEVFSEAGWDGLFTDEGELVEGVFVLLRDVLLDVWDLW